MNESTALRKKYFAAANSFNGFVSYFDSLFSPNDYSKIFVLKGGPGTGKNSLMKKVRDAFMTNEYITEEIYCSSDTSSLDGIIIESEKEKIAVIDGTAPHERDAKIPGAIDEMINLGDNWDTRWLCANRKKILPLAEEKKKAYDNAYGYLKIGKGAFELIKEVYENRLDANASRCFINKILKDISSSYDLTEKFKLVSAFGKNGYEHLDTMEKISASSFTICGNKLSAMLFMKKIRESVKYAGLKMYSSPYPLSNELYEAVYLPESNLSIFITEAHSGDLNADELIKLSSYDLEKIKKAEQILDEAKLEAIRWFKIASDLHFRLEEIYSQAMYFEKNSAAVEKIILESKIILDKNK